MKLLLLLSLVFSFGATAQRVQTIDASCLKFKDGLCIDKNEFNALDGVTSNIQTQLNSKDSITPGTTSQYFRGDKSWQTLDKSAVGLGNVDNTSDANKPISTATQAALNLKANIASPTFTGDPKAPTPTPGDNDTSIATTAFVSTAVSNATIPDATTLIKGKVQLAGDLGGTADLPTVPGLALKANIASPTLTGDPKAPKASFGDNDTSLATTSYVRENAYPLQSDIASGIDLDTISITGIYHQPSNTGAASGTNYPAPYAGKLEVFSKGNMIYQTYHVYQAQEYVYYRGKYNTIWTAWKRVANTGDFDAAAALANERVIKLPTSTANEVASFSGTDGKTIQNTTARLTTAGVLTGLTGLTSSGSATFSGALNLSSNSANSQSGSNIIVNSTTSNIIRFTNSSLVSIAGYNNATGGRITIYINDTGSSITVLNDSPYATTVTNRISTTDGNLNIPPGGSFQTIYNSTIQRHVVIAVSPSVKGSGGVSAGGFSTHSFKLNGIYGGVAAFNGVDGLWIVPGNIEIHGIYIYQENAGSSGTTELDLKVKPFGSGSFTSIFSTRPKITPSSGNDSWCGIGMPFTGCTQPVMTNQPLTVSSGSAIRMDLVSTQSGPASGVGLVVIYRGI